MRRIAPVVCAVLTVAVMFGPALGRGGAAHAQEREDRTLLTWEQMRAIINEASGDRALQAVLEMVPYPRIRDRAEYTGHFRESEMMARLAREYGYASVEIESFPAQARIWHTTQAELWMVEPELRKLYDARDVLAAIAGNSEPGDVTAEVVDVGVGGRAQDYDGKEVAGKIVLGSAGPNALQRFGVFDRGAAGVISYSSLRADSLPDQILNSGVSANAPQGKSRGFGWNIAPRVAREIAGRLQRGEKVKLRSVVKSEYFPGELETVHAMIPGDGTTEQDVIISAHLYEGYQKQGANDDASGCAVTLEMGRTLIRLIAEGKLPKPKRNIHFLWVPEISGTTAWLRKHEDVKKRLIADLNFDMEGIGLARSGAMWILLRTPDTFPSFLNDLCASFLEFIASLNRERVRYRHNGYRYTLPVISPNGSQDPFYIFVEKHYGASDHVVYMREGIPAVIFNTWPDPWYHSSHDTPDKLDPTQFKRVAVVGAAAAITLAAAGDVLAARVAAESLARGTERLGQAQRKGLGYLADAGAENLADAFKEARNTVRHQAEVEAAVVRSTSALFERPANAQAKWSPFQKLIEARAAALQNEVRAFYDLRAAEMSITQVPAETDLEKEAGRLLVESVAPATPGGGGQGGGFAELQAAMRAIPQHMSSELTILLGQKKTALEIRNFLAGEFEPLPLADVMSALRALEKAGRIKLTLKPEPPPAPTKKPAKKK